MIMIKRIILLLVVFFALLFFVGCHLDIKSDVDYPAGVFQETLKKIDKIHSQDPGRKGKVTNLNFLVYDGNDRKLISFSIPMEITKMAIKESGFGENGELKKYSEKIKDVEIDYDKLKDLDRLGPGLLVEVEVEEDKGKVHVLIWLD
jgi:hypothetical protein